MWTKPPDSLAREIQNDGHRTTARHYQCPYIENTQSQSNDIMYKIQMPPRPQPGM